MSVYCVEAHVHVMPQRGLHQILLKLFCLSGSQTLQGSFGKKKTQCGAQKVELQSVYGNKHYIHDHVDKNTEKQNKTMRIKYNVPEVHRTAISRQ